MYCATTGTFLQRDPLEDPDKPVLGYSHAAVTKMLATELRSRMSNRSNFQTLNPDGEMLNGTNLYEYVKSNPLRFTDPLGFAPEPGFLAGYWYYLTHPGQMDSDLQNYQNLALTTAAVSGAAAGGLAYASYAGVSQIGAVGLTSLPTQAAIELHMASGAAVTLTATCARHGERAFQNSRAFISWAVTGVPGRPDPFGAPGAMRYDFNGTFNGSKGVYELLIDKSGKVLHFLFRSN